MSKFVQVYTLKQERNGRIAVFTDRGVVRNIIPNIVRCALGEDDMNYLLRSRNQEPCFSITESEYRDMFR